MSELEDMQTYRELAERLVGRLRTTGHAEATVDLGRPVRVCLDKHTERPSRTRAVEKFRWSIVLDGELTWGDERRLVAGNGDVEFIVQLLASVQKYLARQVVDALLSIHDHETELPF